MTPDQAAAVKLIPWVKEWATRERSDADYFGVMDASFVNQCLNCAANLETILAFLEEAKGVAPENDAERLRKALEDIALLDEADGHELREHHAFEAVAIATRALGKHPSEIYHARTAQEKNDG
jgi:hypothetical protein